MLNTQKFATEPLGFLHYVVTDGYYSKQKFIGGVRSL